MRDKFGWGWGFGWADGDDSAPTPPPFGPSESLYDRSIDFGPANGITDAAVVLGISCYPLVDGRVNGLWFWKTPEDNESARPIAAYLEGDTIAIRTGASTAEPLHEPAQWVYIPFDSPLDVTALTLYVFAILWADTSGHWVITNGFFGEDKVTNLGHFIFRGFIDPAGPNQNGRYQQPIAAGLEYPPNTSLTGASYWIDVDFQAAL